jgi:hypothetical protein
MLALLIEKIEAYIAVCVSFMVDLQQEVDAVIAMITVLIDHGGL